MSNTNEEMDRYCEQTGFKFHRNGRGKWGANPYWSFGNLVEYHPATDRCRITAPRGQYTGTVESVKHFRALLAAMQIEPDSIHDAESAAKIRKEKVTRKMELANRIAKRIMIRYGFRWEKALNMAMQGRWYSEVKRLSQMTNRIVDVAARQVMDDIERGKIK